MPIENLLPLFPTLTYQLFFDRKTDEAIAELDKDVRRSLRATLRTADSPPPESFLQSGDSFLAAWDSVKEVRGVLKSTKILIASKFRSSPFLSSRLRKRIISSSSFPSKVLKTVSLFRITMVATL